MVFTPAGVSTITSATNGLVGVALLAITTDLAFWPAFSLLPGFLATAVGVSSKGEIWSI